MNPDLLYFTYMYCNSADPATALTCMQPAGLPPPPDDSSCSDAAEALSTVRATEADDSGLTLDHAVSDSSTSAASLASCCVSGAGGGLPAAAAALAAAQERRATLMRDAALAPLVRRGEAVFEAIAELNVHHPASLKAGLAWCVCYACCACCAVLAGVDGELASGGGCGCPVM